MSETDEELWWKRPTTEWPDRIIVMRHAKHSEGRVLTDGRQQVRDVAGALAEWCYHKGTTVEQFTPFTPCPDLGDEVVETAHHMQVYFGMRRDKLGQRCIGAEAGRSSATPGPWPASDLDERLVPTYLPDSSRTRDPKPRLVVLNEPQAGRLIRQLSGDSMELRRGELVLLERVPRLRWWRSYQTIWTMAPSVPRGDPLLVSVREKVASKMRTAGVLAGLITALLTFVLTRIASNDVRWSNWLFASLVALAVGAALFFVALFFYDSLTMPHEFWGNTGASRAKRTRRGIARPVRERRRGLYWSASQGWMLERPPSGTSRVVQLNMVRVWSWVFRPAVLAIGVGGFLLLFALDDPTAPARTSATTVPATTAATDAAATDPETAMSTAVTSAPTTAPEAATNEVESTDARGTESTVDLNRRHWAVLLAAALIVTAWSYWFRPRLGASD